MSAMRTLLPAWTKALLIIAAAGLAATAVTGTTGAAHAHTLTGARQMAATPSPTPSPPSAPSSAPATAPAAPSSTTTPATVPPPVSSTPAPAPGQGPSTGPAGGSGGCGFFDLGCEFGQAVNGFFRGLVSYALNPVFRFLARSVLSTPRVDQMGRVHSLWTTSAWIADTSFVLLVLLGGLFIMGHQTLQTSFTAKDLGPRLVVAIVAANMNLPLIGQAIEFANALSQTFMGRGVDEAQAANTLKGLILHALTDATDPFTGLLALVAVIAGLVVLFTFAIRVMLLVLLTAAAPLALACHALPQAEGLARMWWRAVAGVLAIQVAQALVLATALRVFFTSDQTDLFGARSGRGTFDLILVICLLYILARIPFWVSQMIFRGGLGRSPIVRAARTIAALLIFRNVGALKAGRAAGGPRRPPRLPPPPPNLPPPVPPSNPPTWVQPQLPFPPSPPAGGTQLQLPITPPPQSATPSPGWTQLRLPATSGRPSRWQQTALPIRPRYTQTRLPAPPARGHTQPELPLHFPPPGSPQAGRSPRRLADTAALRDAEARAQASTTVPSSNPWRNR
ncbi:hypothetical protein [Actinoallomurus sp. NPDC052274]|uniref:hypothetical protein n=1 Tax=Actinoallomurus sp. NPDC052274 TaxID=3155420 RepID=UPI003429C23D